MFVEQPGYTWDVDKRKKKKFVWGDYLLMVLSAIPGGFTKKGVRNKKKTIIKIIYIGQKYAVQHRP